MRRRPAEDDPNEMPGQDSFLDIIANIVGILILLVVIVGVRAAMLGRSTTEVPPLEPMNVVAQADIDHELNELRSKRDKVEASIDRIVHLKARNELRDAERESMATYLASFEQEIAARRARLATSEQRDFDLRRELVETQQELEQLSREQIALANYAPERIELKNEPTPIAKLVGDDEVIFRIKDHRVVLVPVDELFAEFERREGYRLGEIIRRNGAYGTIGPIGGFRMHYEIVHRHVDAPNGANIVTAAPFIEFKPTNSEIGESIDEALRVGSAFMTRIAKTNPRREAVTFFVYPDSYAEFRQLRDVLRERGFAIAARPLHADAEIASSPFGRKSSAQ